MEFPPYFPRFGQNSIVNPVVDFGIVPMKSERRKARCQNSLLGEGKMKCTLV